MVKKVGLLFFFRMLCLFVDSADQIKSSLTTVVEHVYTYHAIFFMYVLSTLKYHQSCHPNWTTTQKKPPEITDIINSKLEHQQQIINIQSPLEVT